MTGFQENFPPPETKQKGLFTQGSFYYIFLHSSEDEKCGQICIFQNKGKYLRYTEDSPNWMIISI